MKIGICIPCHYAHICYIDCVLSSINKQIVLPDYVSISISEYNYNEPLNYKSDKYEIIITTTKDQKNAGENRNIAAEALLSKVDIISFFDADDYMHPARLQIIKIIFENDNLDILLHDYYDWTTELQQKHVNDILPLMNSNNIKNIVLKNNFNYEINTILPFGRIYLNDNSYRFHNAHVSIKVDAFKKQQYPTSDLYFNFEDSHFNYLHYMLGSKIKATNLQLSLYAIDNINKESTITKALKLIN